MSELIDSPETYIKSLESISEKEYDEQDKLIIESAYNFAKKSHCNQFRKSGQPFFTHPVEVSKIIATFGGDIETIASALLHDVVEDCNVSLDTIGEKYGKEIANIVDGVTKINTLNINANLESKTIKARDKIEYLRKMMMALVTDPRVIIVKLADRLHNMRTLKYVSEEKKKEKALETLKIYAPIAHRVGIHVMKWELEDLSFKYLYPEQYQELKKLVNKKISERREIIQDYQKDIEEILAKNRIAYDISGRIKHLYSIWQKMVVKGKAFDEIYDLFALRIITKDVTNCYKALGVVHSLWNPQPDRFKDYIASPKSNGYKSLHTTVITRRGEFLEIQIRSREMHVESEYGLAAHWKYKEKNNSVTNSKRKNVWLRQLNDWHKDLITSFGDIEVFSQSLVSEEVYVFTPKGEIIHLPSGSTPIDFAYAIHTEIGHHFGGAKVNGRMVPLNYHLKLGEVVEILVNKQSKGPSLDWLKYVKSNSTKAKIRRYLKSKYSDQLIESGREVFRKVSKRLSKPMEDLLNSEEIKNMMTKIAAHNQQEFFMKIGDGSITIGELLNLLYPKTVEEEEILQKKIIKKKQNKGNEVIIGGQTGIDVHFAKCCNPLPGEDIIGIISSRGISVHKRNCRNIKNISEERVLEAHWGNIANEKFISWIIVFYDNSERRIDGKIVDKIESRNATIDKYTVENGKWGLNKFKARVVVRDIGHLTLTMEALRNMKGVQKVERTGGIS